MAVSTGMQGGCKPSRFVAESNLHGLEEQKAPRWWLFPSRVAPVGAFWGSAPLLQLLVLQELGKQSRRAGQAPQPVASRVSVAGAGAVPTAVPAWWSRCDASSVSPASTRPRGILCLALRQVSSQAA